MRLPAIHPVHQADIYTSGEVTLQENVVVASGVILQAAPNCRITIEESVCLGMGVVIRASGGDIVIESGVVLGAGVLVVGAVKIGRNTCIGASSTVMNTSVDAMMVIPSGSLMGDTSRQVAIPPVAEFGNIPAQTGNSSQNTPTTSKDSRSSSNNSHSISEDPWQDPSFESIRVQSAEVEISPPEIRKSGTSQPVVGQVYINQLLLKLFPEREAFQRSQQNPASES